MVQLITWTEVNGTIYACYVWVVMHFPQSNIAVVERICWPWVNTVSTTPWPGSKHKRQATASVKVRTLDAFYWEQIIVFTLTVILIATELLWQCNSGLKWWKYPPAPNWHKHVAQKHLIGRARTTSCNRRGGGRRGSSLPFAN